jgi:hypothetical protein
MIFFRISLIIVIAVLNASAGSVERCTYPSECTFVVTSSDDQSVLDSIESELIGDVDMFKQGLTDSINLWIMANHENDICMASPCDTQFNPKDIILSDIYEFAIEPNLAILAYYANGMERYFIGYIKSKGLWFPLSDIHGKEIEVNFSKIIELCPQLRKSPLICKSAILLGLKYIEIKTYILYHENDLSGAYAYDRDKSNRPPDSLRYSRPLYILDMCENSTLSKYINKEWFQENLESLDGVNELFPMIPPRIKYGETIDTVLLTVYNDYFGEIAEWQFFYDKDGFVISMDCTREPLSTNYGIAPVPGSEARIRKYGPAEWEWE